MLPLLRAKLDTAQEMCVTAFQLSSVFIKISYGEWESSNEGVVISTHPSCSWESSWEGNLEQKSSQRGISAAHNFFPIVRTSCFLINRNIAHISCSLASISQSDFQKCSMWKHVMELQPDSGPMLRSGASARERHISPVHVRCHHLFVGPGIINGSNSISKKKGKI